MMAPMRTLALLSVLAASLCFGTASAGAALPPIKHVWIVVLENKSYETTFGASAGSPYLAQTLRSQGQLLTNYYGTGHSSLDNYITMISGQPPDPQTQADCGTFSNFAPTAAPDANGVEKGSGCVYPARALTISDQLEAKGLTWKGYMQDMGTASASAPLTTCDHPAVGTTDNTEVARADDQYATKHNPFVYFHSIIDEQATCDASVVDLNALDADLSSASTTPAYSFITPDLCADGHDNNCADGTSPGGYAGINNFLTTWIPKITGSPAYADGGLLIVTFDEASGDATACCGEVSGPNVTNAGGSGPGGGRIGAVAVSPYIKANSTNDTPYNHYSLLRSTEDLFGLSHLGYAAQDGLVPFGDDVFNQPSGKPDPDPGPGPGPDPDPGPGPGPAPDPDGPKPTVKVKGVPSGCVPKSFKVRVTVVAKRLRDVRFYVGSRKVKTSKARKFTVKVKTKKLRKGKHHVTARVRDKKGRAAHKTVKFKVCR
jgi:hypothetical protein